MSKRGNSGKATTATDATWLILGRVLRSMRSRPVAWLLSIWLTGWALFAWHIIHPGSWEAARDMLYHAVVSPTIIGSANRALIMFNWLHEVGRWGQLALYISTALLALYVGCALWVWRRYSHQLAAMRAQRFQGGRVLEVIVPSGSKADARAASDMLGQLWNFLSGIARENDGQGFRRVAGTGNVGAERLAMSLEMWSTPQNDGKAGFYIWCPVPKRDAPERDADGGNAQPGLGNGGESGHLLVEEIRHLVMAHYPRCRVRWVEDPLEQALTGLGQAHTGLEAPRLAGTESSAGVKLHWCELSLLADGRFPIGSGAADERLLQGNRSSGRPGSPGAGSDPLAAVISMLGSDDDTPLTGIQIVAAARPETAGQAQQAVNRELASLRELELREGKKAVGPQHEARVLALEEKADRHGYDVAVRLVVAEAGAWGEAEAGSTVSRGLGAEARLTSLLRVFTQYDRSTGGVVQGFRVARRGQSLLNPSGPSHPNQPFELRAWLRPAAPVVARWPREGVCLPRMLPFMRMGRPCILNVAELSAIYHFPHSGLEGLRTLRWSSYRHIPPPAYARVTPEQVGRGERVALGLLDDDLPPVSGSLPGADSLPGPFAPVTPLSSTLLPPGELGVGTHPQDLRRGTYVFGPMGSGKSVFLYNAIVQCMAAKRGVGLIDGKGDSYEEVLRLVPPHLEGDVLTFDPENRPRGATGPAGRSLGINPLDGRLVAQFGAEKVESLTMSLMRKMMGANWEQAVLMQRFLRNAITAVLQVEPRPTMLDLWRWLQDDGKGGNEYRASMLGRVRNKLVQDFWQAQVGGMSSQQRSSMQNVLTRVDRYINNEVRHVILQPYSTVNFREIMDAGTIFVARVSPRLGEDQAFLGALVVNGFLTGALARQAVAQEARRDYLLVVDEFQNFVDTAKADVERMLSMARGYRLGLMLAHQFTEQLPREMLSAILKNVQTWVLFGLQADDARLFAGYMGLDVEDFQNLPPYHSYQRTVVGNRQTGVYSARPLPLPVPADNPGRRVPGGPERTPGTAYLEPDGTQDLLRAAHVPDEVTRLVRGVTGESEEARRARVLKLAGALYQPAEEGDEMAVEALSLLTPDDFELYRRARRRVLDKQERERILAKPQLVPDKAARIERLSELRWGTPCVEIEALILATLHNEAGARANMEETGTVTGAGTSRELGVYGRHGGGDKREKSDKRTPPGDAPGMGELDRADAAPHGSPFPPA